MKNFSKSKVIERIFRFAENGGFCAKGLERALELAGYKPLRNEWNYFLKSLLIFLGIAFLLSGIIFFFAYNWEYINKFHKFAMIETAIALSVIIYAAYLYKYPALVSQPALISAVILTGALLAVFGQIYQTGADSYQLFAVWT